MLVERMSAAYVMGNDGSTQYHEKIVYCLLIINHLINGNYVSELTKGNICFMELAMDLVPNVGMVAAARMN